MGLSLLYYFLHDRVCISWFGPFKIEYVFLVNDFVLLSYINSRILMFFFIFCPTSIWIHHGIHLWFLFSQKKKKKRIRKRGIIEVGWWQKGVKFWTTKLHEYHICSKHLAATFSSQQFHLAFDYCILVGVIRLVKFNYNRVDFL